MASLVQLEQYFSSSTKVPPEHLIKVLEEVNKSELPGKGSTDQRIIDLIIAGTAVIPIDHPACSLFCHFIFKQCTKQIRLSSFRAASFEKCVTYLLDGLAAPQLTAELRVDMLRALGALLYENSTNASKLYARLTPLLLTFAEPSVKPLEIRRMAINCLGNLCTGAGTKLQLYYKDIYQVLLANICVVSHTTRGTMMVASPSSLDFADPAVRKIASSTLRALQFLLSQYKTLESTVFCDIVDIIHTFVFMHVNVQSYQHLLTVSSAKETPSAASRTQSLNWSSRLPSILNAGSLHQQLPWRSSHVSARYLSNGTISSDSEVSDSDSIVFNPRRCRDEAKIRINAVLCLLAIAKTQPRILYPNWSKFIPDSFAVFLKNHALFTSPSPSPLETTIQPLSPILRSDQQPYSLLTLLLYDPMVTVRIAVCHTLIAMLDGSKQYLSVASDRDTKSSFTSLSERLASILRDLHLGLVYALAKETHTEVMNLIMKAISTLMANTSYDRLAPGYLTQLYNAILPHWKSKTEGNEKDREQKQMTTTGENNENLKDSENLQVTILRTLATMMAVNGAADETQALLIGLASPRKGSDNGDSTRLPGHEPLLPLLLSLVASKPVDDASIDTQIEAWHTLSVCARHHFSNVIFNAWSQLEMSFGDAFCQPKLCKASLGFAESYASAMVTFCSNENRLDTNDLSKCMSWWIIILSKYIQAASLDSNPDIRVLTCDCLATLAKPVFEHLPPLYQRLAMALLLPLPEDEEAQVRAASCRALGAFVLFPTLREDTCFVSDMATVILDRMEDTATLVRLRASWAQGNLCDALVIASESSDFVLREWISVPTWMRMVKTATSASLDNDKLRSNAVRAMGSLLRITPAYYFQDRHGISLVRDALAGLVKNIENGSLKTRWNACHASSNMLKNDHFPIGYLLKKERNIISPYDDDDHGNEVFSRQQKHQEYPWTKTVYNALVTALTKCKNYKVRINACLALSTPSHRRLYGNHLSLIYQALISTWKDCHDPNIIAEYQERKYREQLKAQLKEALLHIRDYLSAEDQIITDTLLLDITVDQIISDQMVVDRVESIT